MKFFCNYIRHYHTYRNDLRDSKNTCETREISNSLLLTSRQFGSLAGKQLVSRVGLGGVLGRWRLGGIRRNFCLSHDLQFIFQTSIIILRKREGGEGGGREGERGGGREGIEQENKEQERNSRG